MKLKDRVGVVTGAAGGIGRGVAALFAKEGAKVIVSDINDLGGEETVAQIRTAGGQATYIHCDVSQQAQVVNLMKSAAETYGRIDVLVNNATHWASSGKTVENTSEEVWDATFNIIVKGAYLCSKHAIPEMKKVGGGSIIHVGSIASVIGFGDFAAYVAAKGGLLMLTKTMAIDHGPANIRVNNVLPGIIRTPITEPMLKDVAYVRNNMAHCALKRVGEPEDVAKAVLFLACDDSSYITGAILPVDAGWTAGNPTTVEQEGEWELKYDR